MAVARVYDGWGSKVGDPTNVKHYEILSRIGEGGMGVVYRARDTRLGRTVALKMLTGGLTANAEQSHRFEREARIVSSLSHPGIATIFDFDRDGDTSFITMELVEGPTLREVLADGPLATEELISAASQIADAVAAAHENGIVHRDLKPENIMRTQSGFFKVLDFGVARIDEAEPAPNSLNTQTPTRWLTQAGMLMGTLAYMSPEQTHGEVADLRSDIFSLGTILYEMATGASPFTRPTQVATLHAVGYDEAPSLTEKRPDLPIEFVRVVETCLQRKPDDRYPSAAEFASDLALIHGTTSSGRPAVRGLYADKTKLSGEPPRRRWPLLVGALAIVAVAVVSVMALLPDADKDRRGGVARSLVVQPTAPTLAPVTPVVAIQKIPRVIVAFFENQTGDDSASWVTAGLPEMLTTDLARSKNLELIATQRLHDLLTTAGYDGNAVLDRSTTAELARWADADIVISGAVFKLGETYRIDAQAYDIESGTMIVAHKVSGSELFEMVEELTAGLLGGLTGSSEPMPKLLAVTNNQEAFRAFSEGRSSYEQLDFEGAVESFRESIELDGEFAQPRLQLATSLFAVGEDEKGMAALAQAVANSEQLPEDERLLVQGLDAYFLKDDPETGAARFKELLQRFPRHTDAYVWRGRIAANLEGDPMNAVRQLRMALKIDRDYLPAVISLAAEMTHLGAADASDALLRETADRCPMARDAIESHIVTR
jgi:TolB-like protein